MFIKTQFSSYIGSKIFARSSIFPSKTTNNDKEAKMETMVGYPVVLVFIPAI